MHQPKKKQQDNTCYNFTLKCLAALSAAAVVAGAFIASAATHGAAAAITTKALVTSTTVASAGIASGVLTLGLTLGGVALLIAGVCLLPYLICRSMGPSAYVTRTPGASAVSGPGIFGRGYRPFIPSVIPVSAGGVYPSMPYIRPPTDGGDFYPSHQHGHQPGGAFPSHQHGHQGGGGGRPFNPHDHGHDAGGPVSDGPSSHVHGHR